MHFVDFVHFDLVYITYKRPQKCRHICNLNITSTEKEPYAISYFLTVLFENKSNLCILNDYDEAIREFLDCSEKLEKKERLGKILEAEVSNLENQKILKPLDGEPNEQLVYDDSDIPYKYEQD